MHEVAIDSISASNPRWEEEEYLSHLSACPFCLSPFLEKWRDYCPFFSLVVSAYFWHIYVLLSLALHFILFYFSMLSDFQTSSPAAPGRAAVLRDLFSTNLSLSSC